MFENLQAWRSNTWCSFTMRPMASRLTCVALCAKNALKGVDVRVSLGLQPFGPRGVHASVLGALLVKRRITKSVFAPQLLDRHTGLSLPLETNNLLFAVFA